MKELLQTKISELSNDNDILKTEIINLERDLINVQHKVIENDFLIAIYKKELYNEKDNNNI